MEGEMKRIDWREVLDALSLIVILYILVRL
jgi:hypothetical protein